MESQRVRHDLEQQQRQHKWSGFESHLTEENFPAESDTQCTWQERETSFIMFDH